MMGRGVLVLVSLLGLGCGYRPLLAGVSEGERLSVVLVESRVVDQVAAIEVTSAVRSSLSREGMLASGDRFPRVEVEVLRIDDQGIGVEALPSGDPSARASRVFVVARAWVRTVPGGDMLRDTGDVRASAAGARMPNSRSEAFARPELVRAAARRAGARLGARVLGHPAASEVAEESE